MGAVRKASAGKRSIIKGARYQSKKSMDKERERWQRKKTKKL